MKYYKIVLILTSLFYCWSGLLFGSTHQNENSELYPQTQIVLSLPRISVSENDSLDIPLSLSGLQGQEVYSMYIKIEVDTTVIQVLNVQKTGVSQAWQEPTWNVVNGELRISHFGTTPISGNGNVLVFTIRVIGDEDQSAVLNFNLAALNEGNPSCIANHGILYIGTPYPWFDMLPSYTYNENEPITLQIVAHDPLERNITLTCSNLPLGAVFEDLGYGNGMLSWATNYHSAATYNPQFIATNTDGLVQSAVVQIQVLNVLRPPQIDVPFTNVVFNEDTSYSAYLLSNHVSDSDLNHGDVLSVSLSGNTNVFVNLNSGNIVFHANANWYGTESFSIVVTDSHQMAISQTITATVQNVNDPPLLNQALPTISIAEDHIGYDLVLSTYFSDVDNLLVYSGTGNTHIGFSISGSTLRLVPEADWFGSETFLVTATESTISAPGSVAAMAPIQRNLSVSGQITVIVASVNDPPEILQPFPQINTFFNQTYQLSNLDTYIKDIDSELSFSFAGNANLEIEKVGNTLEITPDPGWVGSRRILVTATDDYLEAVAQELVIIVEASYLYEQNFNNSGSMPIGWTKTGSYWLPYQESGTDYAMRVANPQLSTAQRLTSPIINLDGIRNIEVSFQHTLLCPTGVTAILQYSLNNITYYNIENFSLSETGLHSVAVPQIENRTNVRLRWYFYSTTGIQNYWIIDDLRINGIVGDYVPPSQVQNLMISAITINSATLSWSPVSDDFFSCYEIAVLSDTLSTSQLFLWSFSDDPALYQPNTSSSRITGLQYLTEYYFTIRVRDTSGNISAWSQLVPGTISPPPIVNITTNPGTWFHTHNIVVQCSIQDDTMIDASSIRYRIDMNNNGQYDAPETWQIVSGYSNANSLDLNIPISCSNDGMGIRFEVKCTDADNALWAYSGSAHLEGISDDTSINIDTNPPNLVDGLTTVSHTANSINLSWQASADVSFGKYEIYYSTEPEVGMDDMLFSINEAPQLSSISTNAIQILGLMPNVRYWFSILAVDLAGNRSALSNPVTNVLASILPHIYDPAPIQDPILRYTNSLSASIGCKMSDAYGIDISSIQYRWDQNGNGSYDVAEIWHNVNAIRAFSPDQPQGFSRSYNGAGDIETEVLVDVPFLVQSDILKFEFRVKDVDGFGYTYSGFNSLSGISDDWYVSIDTTPPQAIQNITLGIVTPTSVEIAWTSSADPHFTGYSIYYSNLPGVGLSDSCVSYQENPELINPGSGMLTFTISDLTPSNNYYFIVAAFDIAGNSTISDEIAAFTSSDAIPKAPENLRITILGSDLQLDWDEVIEDIGGNPLTISQYKIYLAESADFPLDESTYFDSVETNSLFLEGVTEFVEKLFFKIVAVE